MKNISVAVCGLILTLGTMTNVRADSGPYFAQLASYSDCYVAYMTAENLLYGFIAYPDSTDDWIEITGSFDGRHAIFHFTKDGVHYIEVLDIQTSTNDSYYWGEESLEKWSTDTFTIGACWQ